MNSMQIRRAEDRGQANFGWLDSRHSFSFGHYYDPANMGFGPLRVINEDRVKGGGGFEPHGHQSMEIISYVLDGSLNHQDSMGNGSTIVPGDVQRMSAGTGVRHSEMNGSASDDVHFLQIWIEPRASGGPPSYEQRHFDLDAELGQWQLLASGFADDDAVYVNQDVRIYGARVEPGQTLEQIQKAGRRYWLQVVAGELSIAGEALRAGDGVAFKPAADDLVSIEVASAADVLWFDLPL